MSIVEKAEALVGEFNLMEDWLDKYNYLIELGKELPIIDEEKRNKQHLISGCQSQVWLQAELAEGRVLFRADSDAIITKGIVAILVKVLSGSTPDEILANEMDFIDRMGLQEHLSPTRSNGLVSMVKQMRLYALAFKTKMKADGMNT
jgi:cysteine desulfuration protein SufE